MTDALYTAGASPSLDEAILEQSDRWARASTAPWTLDEMVSAIWGVRGAGDRESFRQEVRAAVERLVAVGRVKVVAKAC